MFSSPFNWCDHRWERCRLSPICAVAQQTKERPADFVAALESTLRGSIAMAEEFAREEGIDLEGPAPPMPPTAERTKRLQAILGRPDLESIGALVVTAKLARLAERLDDPEADDVYTFDTVPNLLLLERLIEHLHPLKAAAMREELAPLFDAITPSARRTLDTLIETGLAPSPFCVDGDALR